MQQKTLAKWLKTILIGAAICGTVIYAGVIPLYGREIAAAYPEFANRYTPWLVFILLSGVPCYAVLGLAWKIASNIGADKSFSQANAKLLKGIAVLAAGDGAFVFLGNLVFLLLDMNHPSVMLASLFIVFLGAAISVAAAVLSHLVRKAADLQEQSDLTI